MLQNSQNIVESYIIKSAQYPNITLAVLPIDIDLVHLAHVR